MRESDAKHLPTASLLLPLELGCFSQQPPDIQKPFGNVCNTRTGTPPDRSFKSLALQGTAGMHVEGPCKSTASPVISMHQQLPSGLSLKSCSNSKKRESSWWKRLWIRWISGNLVLEWISEEILCVGRKWWKPKNATTLSQGGLKMDTTWAWDDWDFPPPCRYFPDPSPEHSWLPPCLACWPGKAKAPG